MKKRKCSSDHLLILLESVCVVFALRMQYEEALYRNDFKTIVHYLYAQITGILDTFGFYGMLMIVPVAIFIGWMKKSEFRTGNSSKILATFFSFCLLIGRSYRRTGSWEDCFGGPFWFVTFLVMLVGFSVLFFYLIRLFLGLYDKAVSSEWSSKRIDGFLGKKSFRNVFLLLLLIWAPVILLSYPGNLCFDCLGQIEQGLGMAPFSAHHPLLHTLFVSSIIRIGRGITGSYNIGLFLYVIFQSLVLAAALAATLQRMYERKVSYTLRLVTLCIYLFAPMYSNMVSTAIKDIPFMAAVIWYILILENLVVNREEKVKTSEWIKLVIVQILVGLLRNNGIYVVVLTGIALTIYFRKSVPLRKTVILFLCLAAIPFAGYKFTNEVMIYSLSATKGSMGEMFSLPFQQTARYLQLYGNQLTMEEKTAIEGVLRDVNAVAANYNPDIADPVKALYRTDAKFSDLAAYLKVWMLQFFKHPGVYLQAFFVHVYGWFDPGAVNSIRYEASSELFSETGLFSGADKLLIFVYRFAEHVPFLEILENVGFYTWMLFVLALDALRKKVDKRILLAPLFISLLICMVSPCFYLHPRYAYPIMFTLPFLYGVMNGGNPGGGDKASEQDI